MSTEKRFSAAGGIRPTVKSSLLQELGPLFKE